MKPVDFFRAGFWEIVRNLTTATMSKMGATIVGGSDKQNWNGFVLGDDGKLYGIPYYKANNILIINPATGTATNSAMGASLSDTTVLRWVSGAKADNGKIYCAPLSATDILTIDPSTGTATRSTMGASIDSMSSKWCGGASDMNGNVYFAPSNANDILIIT